MAARDACVFIAHRNHLSYFEATRIFILSNGYSAILNINTATIFFLVPINSYYIKSKIVFTHLEHCPVTNIDIYRILLITVELDFFVSPLPWRSCS